MLIVLGSLVLFVIDYHSLLSINLHACWRRFVPREFQRIRRQTTDGMVDPKNRRIGVAFPLIGHDVSIHAASMLGQDLDDRAVEVRLNAALERINRPERQFPSLVARPGALINPAAQTAASSEYSPAST